MFESSLSTAWLNALNNDPTELSHEDRYDLTQEAIDGLDFAEEKLLLLENKPHKVSLLRPIHNTIIRIHELACSLRLRPGLELIQRIKAYLAYVRKESLTFQLDGVTWLFESSNVLQALFQLKQECKREGHLELSQELSKRYHQTLSWFRQQLEEQELYQRSRMEGVAPRLGELLIAQGMLTHHQLHSSLAEHNHTQPLGEQLIERGLISRPQLDYVLSLQRRFKQKTSSDVTISVKELFSLRSLSGDFSATLQQLRRTLRNQTPLNATTTHLVDHLQLLNQELQQRIRGFVAYPIATLFQELRDELQSPPIHAGLQLHSESDVAELQNELVAPVRQTLTLLLQFLRQAHEATSPPTEWHIWLKASHDRRTLVFTLEERQHKLSLQEIQERAIQHALHRSEDSLSPERIAQLLFAHGLLSLDHREQWQNLSTELHRHNAQLAYHPSQTGGGRFTLTVPLPPSYIHGLIVEQQGQRFLLPTSAIREIIPHHELPSSSQLQAVPLSVTEALPTRALQLPIAAPSPHAQQTQTTQKFYVTLQHTQQQCLVGVERVQQEQMVEILFVGSSFLNDPCIAGGCQLSTGEFVWLLDVQQWFEQRPQA